MHKKVLVYSTPTCPFCVMVKDYLAEKNVAYQDIDVSKDRDKAMEMIVKSGQMGVPVVDIGGQVVVGFDKLTIDDLLAKY